MSVSPGRVPVGLVCAALLALLAGCSGGPRLVPIEKQAVIDRREIEYPGELQLTTHITDLTAPVGIAFVNDKGPYEGSILVAESGEGGHDIRITGFRPDGTSFRVYPAGTRIPFIRSGFRMHGPVGGMAVANSTIYVSHRDAEGFGVITALDFEGKATTIVSGLPAQGDYSVTDIAIHPNDGRLYFGIGAATNSGVVGLDNWEAGWVDYYPQFADQTIAPLKLNGYRFTTPNPRGGLFGGDDIAVTAPYQAFGASRLLRIPASPVGKPTAAIYSVNIDGGDLRVEAHGIRLPRGLVFNQFGNLFATNNGMELRGTRPVKDDPDAVLRVLIGGQLWFGWPDYSADLLNIGQPQFQPPEQMLIKYGYPELAALIDHDASGLLPPDRRALLRAVFPALSGAAKMDVVENDVAEPFQKFRGDLLVALSGDRAPFATSGQPLVAPQGRKVMRVDLDDKQVSEFVVNTKRLPGSLIDDDQALERPIDVKFGPDGALYILDFGRLEVKDGQSRVRSGTGKVYRLAPIPEPTTQPAQ